jgi:hypothetical protein
MKSHAMSSMLLYTTIIVYLLKPYLCFRTIVLTFGFQKSNILVSTTGPSGSSGAQNNGPKLILSLSMALLFDSHFLLDDEWFSRHASEGVGNFSLACDHGM